MEQTEWISVEDRLPDESGYYLVFYHEWSNGNFLPVYEDREIRRMRFSKDKPRKWCMPICINKECEADTNRTVTHWMPLPKPPKKERVE